jgi:hypothetical protein
MDRNEEVRQWFDIAKKDFNTADYSFNNMHPVPIESICVNSVEKEDA